MTDQEEAVHSLKSRLTPLKDALFFLFLSQFLVVILGLALPVAYQLFIDQIMGRHMYQWEWPFIAILAAVTLIMGLVAWLKGVFLNLLGVRNAIAYAAQFLWHLLSLPVSFFTKHAGNEIMNRMELNSKVANFLSNQLIPVAINGLLMMIYLVIIVQYDLTIALIGFVLALVNLIALGVAVSLSFKKTASLGESRALSSGLILDALENIETVKATTQENHLFEQIINISTQTINLQQELGKKEVWLSSFALLTEKLAVALLLAVGIWHILHGYLTVGILMGLQVLLIRFLTPFGRLLDRAEQLCAFRADLAILDDVLQAGKDPQLGEEDLIDLPSFPGKLEFRNVTFGYDSRPPVISGCSFAIEPGQRVALVGTTGAGKSTIVKLAGGLYTPQSGAILYAGLPLHRYSRQSRGQSLALVDRDSLFFSGTVRDNLTLWNSEITQEQIVKSAKAASIHEEIMHRPDEYATSLVEGGENFSAGERQRLEIARALMTNPTLLFLDEATSALDTQTEKQIFDNLKLLGCSCLMVTNRLNTVIDCDQILVFDQGKMVQYGTHQQLFKESGLYRRLIEAEDKNGYSKK